ncbi:MAG: MBL fold metallo-hydrolase [Clostridia bacterium]|nr:MBL fold metallo-hydrolase [Clostridia bacterium]
MKRVLSSILSLSLLLLGVAPAAAEISAPESGHKLLYQGHGSLRIVTSEGKVIYIDPYAGEGYDLPADLILVSHGHQDHNKVDLIQNRSENCQIIYNTDALVNGEYKTYDLGYATVEAVQAGNNRNHDINVCVGWLITLSGGVSIYATGDTSTTEQMAELAERDIHYAFFVCDGRYNMDMDEAIACAKTVKAQHSIPYHMAPGSLFDRERAELFDVPGRLIIPAGEEITLE